MFRIIVPAKTPNFALSGALVHSQPQIHPFLFTGRDDRSVNSELILAEPRADKILGVVIILVIGESTSVIFLVTIVFIVFD